MQQSIPIQTSRPSRHILLLAALVTLLGGMYLYLTSQKSKPLPLSAHLEKAIGIEASMEVYEEAIAYAAKNLAVELDIDLKNYDLSTEDYRAIEEAAASKFSDCHQYKLYALNPGPYSCYTCVTRSKVILNEGQTFKIGQTCGSRESRYGRELPEPGLVYLTEFRGNLFEVMVAEYVKLLLFRYSKERQDILKTNKLPAIEMHLPPGNKILR
jgi:hypothetical protein